VLEGQLSSEPKRVDLETACVPGLVETTSLAGLAYAEIQGNGNGGSVQLEGSGLPDPGFPQSLVRA